MKSKIFLLKVVFNEKELLKIRLIPVIWLCMFRPGFSHTDLMLRYNWYCWFISMFVTLQYIFSLFRSNRNRLWSWDLVLKFSLLFVQYQASPHTASVMMFICLFIFNVFLQYLPLFALLPYSCILFKFFFFFQNKTWVDNFVIHIGVFFWEG